MKILILGSTGVVGSELLLELSSLSDVHLTSLSSADLDLYSQLEKLDEVVACLQPQIIINAAGFTDIDAIESNKNRGFLLNCLLPHRLAEICSLMSIQLIHFSSDNVFNGSKLSAYKETDSLSPINYYGWTKAHTDKLLLDNFGEYTTIFRISGIYSHMGRNFFVSFLKRIEKGNVVKVVDDISVSPTTANMVAKFIAQIIYSGKFYQMRGLYNLATKGSTSWFGFARKIVESLDVPNDLIVAVSSDSYSHKVKRPKMSILDCQKLENETFIDLPTWEDSFEEFMTIDSVKTLIPTFPLHA